MKALIIEDEAHAQQELMRLLRKLDPTIQVIDVLPSIRESVQWLNKHDEPDIIFMDIMLADGESFEIFNHVKIESPIIFTTAYNEHALKAFRQNSIDYLLKPIDLTELDRALNKLKSLTQKLTEKSTIKINKELKQLLAQERKEYKNRFVVRSGENIRYISVPDINWFYSSNEVVYMVTHDNKKFVINYTLDELEAILNPQDFFRVSRKYIAKIGSVSKVVKYFNSRLKLELNPPAQDEIIVSRARVSPFLGWLEK